MRKHLLLIMMLVALFPWSLRAQTLTINDGTATNQYIPVYGYYADMSSYAETQFILPSGDLTAMVGSDITSLTFYANYSQDFGNASWDIYMQETNSTTLSSIASYSGNTLVYSGHLAVVSNQLVIEFDASYPYNGNNLLITFHKTQSGTCSSSSSNSFYGVSATNGASAYYSYSFSPQLFLPKVTFTYGAPPTCPKPTELAVSDITSAGATLSWTSSASNFVVAYGTGTTPSEMPTVNAATNSATLTGLNANTVYNVFVKAVCSETDESDWSAMKTFRTDCAAIDLTTLGTIGFETSEGFVSGYNPSSPNCWTFGNMQSASTTYIPYIYNSTYYAHEGNNSLSLYASKSSYTDADSAYAVMPEFSATNLSQYMLRFYARQGSTTSTYAKNLVVGVMTDPMDMSTFVQVGSANVVGTTYAQYEVSLASYSGNGSYIAFLAAVDPESTASTRYAQYYVDNLEVMDIPSCVRPADVAAANISSSSAEISWVAGGTETSWNIQYRVAGGENEWVTINNVTANPYTLTGLTATTNYEVQIQSACSATDQSEYSNSATFTTLCEAVATFPYVENFDGLTTNGQIPNCWNNDEGTTTDDTYKWSYNSSYGTGVTGKCIRFDSYNNSNGKTNFLKSPVLALPAGQIMMLSFQWKNPAGGDFSVYISTDGGQTHTTALATGLTAQSSWKSEEISLAAYTGQNVVIVFKGTSNWGSDDARIYLDDVTVYEAPSCIKPSGLAVSNITNESAELAWTERGTATAWQVDYSTDGETWTTENAGTNPFTLTGLTSNTHYYVKIRSYCSAEDQSEYTAVTDFYTACEVLTITKASPFVENFDSFTGSSSSSANNLPNCWNYVNTSTNSSYYNYPIVYNSSSYSAHNCIQFCHYYSYSSALSEDQYLVLPEVRNDASTLMLQLYAKTSGTTTAYVRSFTVGVMDDPTDASTFTAVETVSNLTTNYAQYESYLNGYEGSGKYVAIKVAKPVSGSYTYSYVYVDDIKLKLIPRCFPVASVSFADVERTSMTINWTKNSNPAAVNTDYQVVLSTTQLDADGLAAATPVEVLNATTYTATNLERNTLYYVYVRSACGGDDYSEWVEATQRTLGLMVCDNTIGDGTIGAGGVPVYSSYGNTYSQQIFTAEELADAGIVAGKITGISYDWNGGGSTQKMLSIYIGSTSKSSFSSASDWVPGSALQLGYGPAVHESTTSGKVDYPFSTPFNWDGTSNIVIATIVNQHNGSTGSSGFTAKGTTATDMAIYKYKNSYPYSYDPSETPESTGNSKAGYRANISFCQDMPACPEITGLQVVNNGVDEVEFGWTASTGDYVGEYEVFNYKADAPDYGPLAEVDGYYEALQHNGVQVVTGTSVTVSHLDENTVYYLYVRALCNANAHDDGMSGWVSIQYRTLADCLAPVDLVATVNGKKDVTVTWTNGSYDATEERSEQESNFYWILATDDITEGGNLEIDINHPAQVAQNFEGELEGAITDDHAQITFSEAEINLLDHNQTYYFYVRNDCGGSGAWVSTTFTTPDECPAVVNLAVSNQTAHTALLTWDKGEYGDETEWKVAWGSNEFYTTEQSFLVYGLAAETTTTVSVYAACDKNHGVFGTAATVEVTTTAEGGNFVQVGNETTVSTYSIPVSNYYKYSYSQQIFDASELKAGTIEAISYQYKHSSAMTKATDVTIYMGHTTKTVFESTADWISISQLTQVYNGALNCSQGWNDFTLDTPFEYNGQDNLIVAVHDNTTSYDGSAYVFYSSYCTGNKTLYYQNDQTACPADAPVAGTQAVFRNNTRFIFVPEDCPRIAVITTDTLTTEMAGLSWMPAGGEMTWNYVVSTSATLDADALDAHTDASIIAHAEDYAQRFVELNGLTPGTQYYLYVQTICDAETVSVWSLPYEFVTVATCVAPTALLVNNITNESAELAWTENGTATAWQVDYSFDGNTWTTVDAGTNPYTLSGLTGNTYYHVRVRAYCSAEDQSVYTAVANFTTECDPISTFPYVENFDGLTTNGQIPNCWNNDEGTITTDTRKWSYDSSHGTGVTGKCIRFESYYNSNGMTNFLKSPVLALPTGQIMMLSFQWKNPTGGDFSVYISTDGGQTHTTALATGLKAQSSWKSEEILLADYAGQNVVIVFKGTSNCGSGDAYIYLDDVTVYEAPSCIKPSGLAVSNITNESAELAWTERGTATAWQVDYSTDGETWTTVDAGTNPYTLTGLTSNTYYCVKVRSYCSAEDQSEYTAVANFTTECDALVIGTSGYTEDFESYDAVSYYYNQGTMPDCWESIFVGTSSSYNVKTCSYSSYAPGSGNYILITVGTYSSYGTANYAILPSISNDYDNLKISFDYKMSSSTGSTVSFGYLTDAADATTFTAIGSALTNSTSNVSKEITLDGYNVPSGACLAFKAYATTSYSFNFSFDNLNIIDTTIVVYAPTALSVSDIGYSGATVSWTAGSTEEKWQYVYGESGFTPDWTNPSEVTATTCTLTGLNSSTDYDVYVRSWYDAETISEPVMISFTTLCEALDLPYSENFESYSSSATGYDVAGIMPNCWDYIFSGINPIYAPHISADFAPTTTGIVLTSGSVSYGSDNYVILPAFNGVQTSKISYSYKMESSNSANGTLYFGYITDVTDASTFVSLNQLTNYQSKTVVSDYVVAGIPANARLAFKWHLSSSYYCVGIDDISVSSVDVFNTDGNIATAANWSGAEVPATTGYIAAEATVSTDFTIADLNILEGGKVIVNSGATLTVTGTLTNSDAANIVIEDGGQLVNASATKATIQKEIEAYASASGTDADGWYLIASPVTDAAASMVTTGTYDFYTHDEAAYMWRNYKVEANQTAYSWLTNGYGYLYANAVSQTLNFAGTVAADGEKEIALAYTSTGDNTGWNLLGNHTAHNVTIESDFDLLSVKVMDINGIDYTDKLVSTDTFAPCEGFFVQATEAGQHVTINPDMVRSQNAPQGFIRLNLVDNNTPVFTDVAYITMEGGIGSENITFSEVAPQLYVPIDGVDYSVAVVDAEQTIIPVSFKATANSMYTISLNLINAHFETVILRDLKTGINTDLKNGDYVFSGNIDDAENRFNLILAVEAPEGIEEDNAPFAYQSGSDIIFTDTYGTVQVMDVLGRVMSETRIDGDARISTRGFVSGTYVLRLLGSESVRTQKIVVK